MRLIGIISKIFSLALLFIILIGSFPIDAATITQFPDNVSIAPDTGEMELIYEFEVSELNQLDLSYFTITPDQINFCKVDLIEDNLNKAAQEQKFAQLKNFTKEGDTYKFKIDLASNLVSTMIDYQTEDVWNDMDKSFGAKSESAYMCGFVRLSINHNDTANLEIDQIHLVKIYRSTQEIPEVEKRPEQLDIALNTLLLYSFSLFFVTIVAMMLMFGKYISEME